MSPERTAPGNPGRASYHHGDLANALTAAATDLARAGGPEAVVLREAARKVGVSATAAYRHFAGHGDLIHAVKQSAQDALAARMERELSRGEPLPDPGDDAVRRLLALGRGYVGFALEEPGLFRTAFCRMDKGHDDAAGALLEAPAFRLLSQTLDELVAAGRMAFGRRPSGEAAAWSIAHGLAMLLLDGPLGMLPEPGRQELISAVLDTLIQGLTTATDA